MIHPSRVRTPLLIAACALVGAFATLASVAAPARAQVFGPPMTLFGSISDSEGPISEGAPVEVYVGDKVCGTSTVVYTGDGDARVATYVADVVSAEQTAGCGKEDTDVRVKVGERFASQTTRWRAGPVRLDLTYGTATPAPIPTFTPTPTPAGATAPADTATPGEGETPTPGGQGGDRSPAASPGGSSAAGTPTRTPPGGGVVSSNTNQGDGGGDGGDGGFPIWAAVILALGGIAVVGGGIGFAMARSRRAAAAHDEDESTLA